jgi:hypothetical protein
MRTTIATLAAGIATTLLLAGQPAEATPHPRVAGLDCGGLARRIGPGNVWRAFFSGEKETLFDHRWPFTAAPCFKTQADCRNWLYWAQTDYPLDQEVRLCRRGLG